MKDIVIIERPESLSWEEIRSTLVEAHRNNIDRGLVVRSTTLSANQLQEQVGDGKCYVALDGEVLVGMLAVRPKPCDLWFCHGTVAHFLLGAVLPQYQGMGIYSRLEEHCYAFAKEQGISIITLNTAANNVRMVKMLPKQGFCRAKLFHTSDTDHFSITWVKWLENAPSKALCWAHYMTSAIKAKVYYRLKKCLNK